MSLYAMADLHLSRIAEKPMDPFGRLWAEHQEKIKMNWQKTVKPEDCVLIGGDISWGMKFEEALPDLEFIHNLNGRKILIRGNHDFWWDKPKYMNTLFDDMHFLWNDYAVYDDYAICGTRGWYMEDEKIYKREVGRLKRSLDAAVHAGFDKIIVLLHYPPTNEQRQETMFTQLIAAYPVAKVVYGHLHHDYYSWDAEGYHLTSADFLGFTPRLLFK